MEQVYQETVNRLVHVWGKYLRGVPVEDSSPRVLYSPDDTGKIFDVTWRWPRLQECSDVDSFMREWVTSIGPWLTENGRWYCLIMHFPVDWLDESTAAMVDAGLLAAISECRKDSDFSRGDGSVGVIVASVGEDRIPQQIDPRDVTLPFDYLWRFQLN